VGVGDRVLTTPLSAFASSLAILRIGAVPVFIDVDDSGLIDLSIAEEVLATQRIPYLLPVHLYGHAVDVGWLRRLTERHGITVIEDCAQAVLATSDGVPVGGAGPVAATSFYPTKNLGCLGDGGAVLLEAATAAERARTWRDYGQSEKYQHTEIGLNSRLDEIQAAILVSVLIPALEAETARRRSLAARYQAGLRNPGLRVPPVAGHSDSVWHLFPVLVDNRRDAFRAHLDRRGIATAIHYPRLIPEQDAIRKLGKPMCLSALRNAERFARAEVSLPLHPYLTDDEAGLVVDACNDWDGT
jgi:dTDP-3-amino-3,4,6-trideoxy-alpha-D-glucose transaminase